MTDSSDSPDFSAEALLLAELAYLEAEHKKDLERRSVIGERHSRDRTDLETPHTKDDSTIRADGEKEASELGDCDYATPCWTLKHSGLMSMWAAMSIYLGGSLRSRRSQQQDTRKPGASVIDDGDSCKNGHASSKSGNESEVGQLKKSSISVPDWMPNCPTCDRSNEYGRTMCDPVLPRTCSNDSLWECAVQTTQTRIEEEKRS